MIECSLKNITILGYPTGFSLFPLQTSPSRGDARMSQRRLAIRIVD
jgi:hypothetical protein